MTSDLNDLLDDLYSTPLAEFTQRRNEAAKALKAEGHKEVAAQIKSLKKPSTAAWVVNQLHFTLGNQIEELTVATEAIRTAHGQPGGSLPEAMKHRRESIDRLMTEARDLLQIAGISPTREQLRRIHRTLDAATTSGADAIPGRLVEDLEAAGFGALAGLAIIPPEKAQGADEKTATSGQSKANRATKTTRERKTPSAPAARSRGKPGSTKKAHNRAPHAERDATRRPTAAASEATKAANAAKARQAAEIKLEEAKVARAEREVTRAEAAYLGAERHVQRSGEKIKNLEERLETAQGVLASAREEAHSKKDEFASAKDSLARAEARLRRAENR